jgi:uroporphyrinogen-III synthase
MSSKTTESEERIPIFLLKTRSTPNDGYEECFSSIRDGLNFTPTFVPVLEHQLLKDGLDTVRTLLQAQEIANGPKKQYGGMIFTSQRAVEAFTKLVDEGQGKL